METNVDNYNDNMRRSITVWAPLDTTVPQMIEALQRIFGDTTNQQVIAIKGDSRVRSISKINIILSTEIACEHLSSQGILLKKKNDSTQNLHAPDRHLQTEATCQTFLWLQTSQTWRKQL